MLMKLKRLGSDGGRGLAVVIEDERGEQTMTEARRDTLNTERGVQDELLSKFPSRERGEIHAHKNRSGTWAYAVGLAPKVWPEDSSR